MCILGLSQNMAPLQASLEVAPQAKLNLEGLCDQLLFSAFAWHGFYS